MARRSRVGRRQGIVVIALLGAGLFAPSLGGALHGIGAPVVSHAATASSADAATATPDQSTDTGDGAAIPEATGAPEPSATTSPGNTNGDQNGTSNGSDVQSIGSGDQGISDEGAVHDGQFGQNDESSVQLQQAETNQVDAGSNTFGNDTTPAQSAPQMDQ
jgi:hypothetical protein